MDGPRDPDPDDTDEDAPAVVIEEIEKIPTLAPEAPSTDPMPVGEDE